MIALLACRKYRIHQIAHFCRVHSKLIMLPVWQLEHWVQCEQERRLLRRIGMSKSNLEPDEVI